MEYEIQETEAKVHLGIHHDPLTGVESVAAIVHYIFHEKQQPRITRTELIRDAAERITEQLGVARMLVDYPNADIEFEDTYILVSVKVPQAMSEVRNMIELINGDLSSPVSPMGFIQEMIKMGYISLPTFFQWSQTNIDHRYDE